MLPNGEVIKGIKFNDKTYKIDFVNNIVSGIADEKEALIQAMQKTLMTLLCSSPIYDDTYGVDLVKFIGKDFNDISGDLKDKIITALQNDDRVDSVESVKFSKDGENVYAEILINCKYGPVNLTGNIKL